MESSAPANPARNLDLSVEETTEGRFLHCRIPLPTSENLPNALLLEQTIAKQMQAIGQRCLAETLPLYDTDGEPIVLGGHRMTSKGQQNQTYQSQFGPIPTARHIYQTSDGGRTYVPLEHNARILNTATPHFSKMVAAKYAQANAGYVVKDLTEHHQRPISDTLVREIASQVGCLALSKEAHWNYRPTPSAKQVATIGLGYDGTCANICYEGWKNVMVASFTLYDRQGERLESFYIAQAPEEGKITFFARADREVATLKKYYPQAIWVGISDGAADLRPELEKHCHQLILDFFHLSEYLAKVSPSMARGKQRPEQWTEQTLTRLKKESGAAEAIYRELKARQNKAGLGPDAAEQLRKTIGYLENNIDRTDYAEALAEHFPIGSGVTEAACKSIVKERFCGSGMKWTRTKLQNLLTIRSLVKSSGRWDQFWARFMTIGL